MKDTLKTGQTATRSVAVNTARTIDFMGDDLRVYATPELVRDIEHCCRDLLLEYCDPGEDSVGTRIELDHMAPTPLGMNARITVTVSEVKGRMVTLDVTARDDIDQIARGRHDRFIVDMAQTAARLAAKREKADS